MVPPGTRGAYTLELAIISITPTNARAGIFVTALSGIKGGGLVKRFIKKGHIAMAGRLRDESGRIVSEFADYEEDHSSLLGVDTKDFKNTPTISALLTNGPGKLRMYILPPTGTGRRNA